MAFELPDLPYAHDVTGTGPVNRKEEAIQIMLNLTTQENVSELPKNKIQIKNLGEKLNQALANKVQELKKYLESNCWDWTEVTSWQPNGWPKHKPWTGKEAAEASKAAGLGLSRSDFSDDGADLQELKEIIEFSFSFTIGL